MPRLPKQSVRLVIGVVIVGIVATHLLQGNRSSAPPPKTASGVQSDVLRRSSDVIQSGRQDGDRRGPSGAISTNTVEVQFPDGEIIALTFRRQPRSRWVKPWVLIDEYQELADAAKEGDPFAAADLAAELHRCSKVYAKTRSDLTELIDRFQQTHKYPVRMVRPGPMGDAVVSVRVDPTEEAISKIESDFEYCSGLSDEQLAEYVEWYKLAAANGHLHAGIRIGVFGERFGLDRDASERLLLQTWNNGSTRAARELGEFYGSRYSPDPANHKLEYAYHYVYKELIDRDASVTMGLGEYSREVIKKVGAHLSPHELAEAQDLAKSILKQNQNCCFAMEAFARE